MSARLAVAALTALCVIALGGCGQRPQAEATYQHGKYQGKPDTRPWDDAPPAYGGAKWTQGDKASWENEIKTRNLSQNEYVRIGQ
jgi:hypothetical protein